MKIKINIKSIAFMTLISIASLLFINISFAANTGKISVETANIRETANTEAKVLELASSGDEVEILEEVDGWYKIKYKKIAGYVRKDLVEVESEAKNEATENTIIEDNTEIQNGTSNEVIETTNDTVVEEEKIIGKGKYKLSENAKIKIIPLISAIEIDEIKKDAEIEVIEVLNDWVKIKTTEGKEGWIRKEKLLAIQEDSSKNVSSENNQQTTTETKTEQNTTLTTSTAKTMYVNSQTVNVRQNADKTSEVVKQLTINTSVTVLSTENGWSYVQVSGIKGYIAENLLSSTKQETSRSATTTREAQTTNTSTQSTITPTTESTSSTTTTSTTADTASATSGSNIVEYAKQFLGCKYVYGGTTTNGFDCSGFTQFVYKHFGINLNRTAAAQYSNGTSVTSLQAGDLVMFGKSGINHVGIYIGGNTFIHAANTSRGVTTDSLSSGYYQTNYVGARRIL